MLEFQSVTQRFGATEALSDVTLKLNEAIVGLVGVNGAGKSTLMKVAVGQIRPTDGLTILDGESASRRGALIGYCPQEVDLPGNFTCAEFLSYVAWLRKLPRHGRLDEVETALDAVDLTKKGHQKISSLSGGMRRRLTIAQALLGSPTWILLDEPTTGLDPEQRASIRALLADMRTTSKILISSHIIEDVAALADRVIFLHDGRVIHDEVSPRDRDASDLEQAFLRSIVRGA